MGPHLLHPGLLEEAEGGGEGHRAGDVRRAALVPVGRLLVVRLVLGHVDDRATRRDVGRGLVEKVGRPEEERRAERRVGLVTRPREEVDVAGVGVGEHVERRVGEDLGAVDQDLRPAGVGHARDAVDVREVAGHVRGAGDRHELHLVLAQLRLEVVVVEGAVVLHPEVDDPAPRAVRQVVRVVLHQRDEGHALAVRHDVGREVEGLGGVPAQDHRVRGAAPVDEAEDVVRDVLEAVGGHLREVVASAVDVRVGVLEEVLVGVEHGRRRVGARAVVHVDERLRLGLAEHLEALARDGELVPDPWMSSMAVSRRRSIPQGAGARRPRRARSATPAAVGGDRDCPPAASEGR